MEVKSFLTKSGQFEFVSLGMAQGARE